MNLDDTLVYIFVSEIITVLMSCFLRKFGFFSVVFVVMLAACAVAPPVQEMSNARQSIKAAEEVGAQEYAAELLEDAKERLKDASDKLEAGEYEEARQDAMDAKEYAIKAHQQAMSQLKKVKK